MHLSLMLRANAMLIRVEKETKVTKMPWYQS